MTYTTLALAFLFGVLFHILWDWILNTGYSIVLMQTCIKDCLVFMARNIQETYEIGHLKQEALRLAGKDEKYIDWQSRVNEREIKSIKTTCIRNFINAVPPRYNHLIKFHDWDSAMTHNEKIIKEER